MQDEDFKVSISQDEKLGEINYKEFCNFLDSQVFLVHDMLLADKENYKMYFKKFYDYMKQGFERPEVRKHPIKFKFTDNPRILRVSFFGPFYGDYRIMLLDEDYQWVLVGGSDESYLWILARTPKISDEVKDTILAEATRRGYDVSKLIWVKQE